MTKRVFTLALASLALSGLASLAMAQTAPPPAAPAATPPPAATAPAKPAVKAKAPAKVAKPKADRTPESLACSAEADAKGLKGKERKAFRRKCVADAKKAAGPAKAAPAKAPTKAPAPVPAPKT